MTVSNNQPKSQFHDDLKKYMDELIHLIYDLTLKYPKEELYGLTSQLRRAGLSIILNYIEGYARKRTQVMKNFYEISYGSLKETKYLIYFSYRRNFITELEYEKCLEYTETIGKMLRGILEKL